MATMWRIFQLVILEVRNSFSNFPILNFLLGSRNVAGSRQQWRPHVDPDHRAIPIGSTPGAVENTSHAHDGQVSTTVGSAR